MHSQSGRLPVFQEDVCGLNVAVHDLFRVDVAQRAGNAFRNAKVVYLSQRRVLVDLATTECQANGRWAGKPQGRQAMQARQTANT